MCEQKVVTVQCNQGSFIVVSMMLFCHKQSRSCLADSKVGFNNWRLLSLRILHHENSSEYQVNCLI